MGWLDSIFGGLSKPDYDKMLKERLEKEQIEKDAIFDMSKNVDQINKRTQNNAIAERKSKNDAHKEEAREERKKEEKAADDLKLVLDTAKLQCDLCVNPIGDLKVNFKTPTIQGKKIATVKEKDMKSVMFKGNCKKSPQSASPCASMMQLGDWEDVGTIKVQDQFPLLLKSTIKCNYGGVPIKITDCAQVNEPADIESTPKEAKKEKKILNATWMCAAMEEEIKEATIGDKVTLLVKTRNYKEGETLSIIIDDINGYDVKEGEREMTLTGTVGADGSAELKKQVVIEDFTEIVKHKTDKELQQKEAQKNEIYVTHEGKGYTRSEWKEQQENWQDEMDAAKKK
ncbi:ribosomal protein L12E/L44/L45/RPP1/RPP2 [Flavobacterium sp. 7E]|nr:DUF4280 domain-containing protein [Flavobacterium sp. 7E]NRS90771.1 ribosomal protein L12E/L44/L45/RPP1/RPP2 [Flavobacterium sp. 7E]